MRKINIVCLIIILFVTISCDKQDRENTYINQENSIDTYISSLDGAYRIVRTNGSNRIVIEEGDEATSLEKGDSLHFFYSLYTFANRRGGLIYSNVGEIVRQYNIEADTLPKKILYGKDELINGLYNGLYGVRDGEKCYILFSAKYGYGNKEMFNVPKLTPLFFEVEIKKLIKNN